VWAFFVLYNSTKKVSASAKQYLNNINNADLYDAAKKQVNSGKKYWQLDHNVFKLQVKTTV